MKNRIALSLLAASALVIAATLTGQTAGDPQAAVDQRVAAMKQMGGKVNLARQLTGTDAKAAQAALAEAIAIAQSIPTRFPTGTFDGDAGVSTRALPKIASDAAGFQKAADGLVAAMKAVDGTLAAGGAGAEAAFEDVGKACGTCHDSYRGPKK